MRYLYSNATTWWWFRVSHRPDFVRKIGASSLQIISSKNYMWLVHSLRGCTYDTIRCQCTSSLLYQPGIIFLATLQYLYITVESILIRIVFPRIARSGILISDPFQSLDCSGNFFWYFWQIWPNSWLLRFRKIPEVLSNDWNDMEISFSPSK